MFFKKIVTEGLEQFSYMGGDGGAAFVIDPRWDVEIYLQEASKAGLRITHVFETHRHEDILSGGKALAQATGAIFYRSKYEKGIYAYGTGTGEGERFSFGEKLTVEPLHTPGHTLGHLAYVLKLEGTPFAVCTGDCLFYGSVGRTDFYGEERLEETTSLLHDSIYTKLASLGEEIIILPAHGAGSACGNDLESREFSTLHYEMRHNKALSRNKQKFLAMNAKTYPKNPGFVRMEEENEVGGGTLLAEGVPVVGKDTKAQIVDLRDRRAYFGGHLLGSLHIPAGVLATWAGWMLSPKDPVVLLAEGFSEEQKENAWRTLLRTGFAVQGALPKELLDKAEVGGKPLQALGHITAPDYLKVFKERGSAKTLDVRLPAEYKDTDPILNRVHIPIQELRDRIEEVPTEETLYVLCGSGQRAAIAASYVQLKKGIMPLVIEGGGKALYAAMKAEKGETEQQKPAQKEQGGQNPKPKTAAKKTGPKETEKI